MKIEAGAYYKCRNGMKAYVDCIKVGNPFVNNSIIYPLIGYVEGFEDCTWTTAGRRFDGGTDALDLVAEWREPVSQSCILAMYRYTNSAVTVGTFDNETHMRNHVGATRATLLAIKQITLTEGEGI